MPETAFFFIVLYLCTTRRCLRSCTVRRYQRHGAGKGETRNDRVCSVRVVAGKRPERRASRRGVRFARRVAGQRSGCTTLRTPGARHPEGATARTVRCRGNGFSTRTPAAMLGAAPPKAQRPRHVSGACWQGQGAGGAKQREAALSMAVTDSRGPGSTSRPCTLVGVLEGVLLGVVVVVSEVVAEVVCVVVRC